MQIRKVFKSGGSLCLAVPREYARALGVRLGSYVSFTMSKAGAVQLTKAGPVEEEGPKGGNDAGEV